MSKWRKETLELAVQLVIAEGVRVAVACRDERQRTRDMTFVLKHLSTNCDLTDWKPVDSDDPDHCVVEHDNGGWIGFLTPGEGEGMRATHIVQIGLFGVQTMFDPADYGL
jgi:hypothetical protein